MTKADLIKRVSDSTGLKYEDAKNAVEVFFKTIQEALLRRHFDRKHGPGAYYGQPGDQR